MACRRRRQRAEVLEGLKVKVWTDQQTTADWLGVTTRTVQRLERKGMPSRGSGRTKEHPFPLCGLWFSEHEVEKAIRGACLQLDFQEALQRHREFAARIEAGTP